MNEDPIVFLLEPEHNDRICIGRQLDEVNLEHKAFSSVDSFLSALDPHQLGCVLTELKLGNSTAFQFLKRLRQMRSSLPIILLTSRATVPLTVQAFKAGLFDVLEKPSEAFQLWECATRAFENHGRDLNESSHRESIRSRMTHLSRQELQVMQMILEGEQNKRIAARLGLSPRTIVFRRKSLMAKMSAKSVAELACLINSVSPQTQRFFTAQSTSLLDFHVASNMFDSFGKLASPNDSSTTADGEDSHVFLPSSHEQ
jgi:FixJ family two-component response regulator